MKRVELYTDGGCSGNPGPGGYCAILIYKTHYREVSGGDILTTNNRMELTAVIAGLEELKEPCEVVLTSDSKYVLDPLRKGWLEKWEKNNWVKSDKKPVLNLALWKELLEEVRKHKMIYKWIKGHSGHIYNERCDGIASDRIYDEIDKAERKVNRIP
ncbi:MAG: ribonuclease HI [Clostridia bacterium]